MWGGFLSLLLNLKNKVLKLFKNSDIVKSPLMSYQCLSFLVNDGSRRE